MVSSSVTRKLRRGCQINGFVAISGSLCLTRATYPDCSSPHGSALFPLLYKQPVGSSMVNFTIRRFKSLVSMTVVS